MTTEKEKVSYLIGRQVFENLQQQKLEAELDFNILAESIKSAAGGQAITLAPEEAQAVFGAFQQRLQAKMQEEVAEIATANQKEGEEFLTENATGDDIHTTGSGLQYRILKEGNGTIPAPTDTVETHYEGRLISGEVFDSSYQRGQTATFPVNGVIQGWVEALQLMPEGSKWELFIPAELAYGPAGSPPKIGPNSTLIFDIELIAVK